VIAVDPEAVVELLDARDYDERMLAAPESTAARAASRRTASSSSVLAGTSVGVCT
jgi:hypothetical protein